jgi:DNA ligase-1
MLSVVAAEQGHGKRSHVLSDYTFAVRDDATGSLLTIGKAYSGLTDLEIEELTEHFIATSLVDHGRYREVRPRDCPGNRFRQHSAQQSS